MIHLAIRKVRPEHLNDLRAWMEQLNGPRREEALATLDAEGCSHELAVLVDGADGPLIIYVMEVESLERSREAVENSPHPIDHEHRAVLERSIGVAPTVERLLELRR